VSPSPFSPFHLQIPEGTSGKIQPAGADLFIVSFPTFVRASSPSRNSPFFVSPKVLDLGPFIRRPCLPVSSVRSKALVSRSEFRRLTG